MTRVRSSCWTYLLTTTRTSTRGDPPSSGLRAGSSELLTTSLLKISWTLPLFYLLGWLVVHRLSLSFDGIFCHLESSNDASIHRALATMTVNLFFNVTEVKI